jgi:hypothetical protein
MFLIIIFLSFKKAARGGGVYPDVMFEVAKHWYELYNKNLPAGNAMATPPPGNLLKNIDNKTVIRYEFRSLYSLFTYVLFSVTHFLKVTKWFEIAMFLYT